jgi:N-acetylglucosaminyldiphosphoundecaprenol N-acetyl-beta-D-mannosaminyltransferase
VTSTSEALDVPTAGAGAAAGDLRRVALFGLRFVDAPAVDDVAAALLAGARRDDGLPGSLPVVVTPNVDHLVHLEQGLTAPVEHVLRHAAVVLPDGQPIVWASRVLGTPLRARLPGSGLVEVLWPALVARREPVVVVAPNAVVADHVRRSAPAARVVVAPLLSGADDPQLESLAAEVVAAAREAPGARGARFVFVAIGFPNQCLVIDRVLERWPASAGETPVLLAVGAAFELLFGIHRRAPRLVQQVGLEWFYRFVQEPRRLFHRYFRRDLAFGPLVWRAWRAQRRA